MGSSRFALISGTSLDRFQPWEIYIMVDREKGTMDRAFADPERSPKMGEQFDAVLYLGPPASITLSELPAASCTDHEYMEMRAYRATITAVPAAAANAGAALRKYCSELGR